MVAAVGAAQTENDKGNLLTKAKAFLNRSVVHGVDTNYVKTPSQPWQISVKSRVAQTDLQMPMVTLLNQTRINTYESNLEEVMNKHLIEYALRSLFADEGVNADNFDFSDDARPSERLVHQCIRRREIITD